MAAHHYTVVVIGSGFGGTMTALALARQFELWNKDHPNERRRILMLERGTWWTTPVGTVQDPEVATYDFLRWERRQAVQVWPSQNHFRGVLDLMSRCRRHDGNPDGLYDFMSPGRSWLFGLLRLRNDGVSVLRASGIGGGSLVYSNITIEPPDLIFKDPRWGSVSWSPAKRQWYYNLARKAIGRGAVFALDEVDKVSPPKPGVNTGLSRINTRTAGLNPHWRIGKNGRVQLDPDRPTRTLGQDEDSRDKKNHLWLDRARMFQSAVSQLTADYGAVDLAINDYIPIDPTSIISTKPPDEVDHIAAAAADNQYDATGDAKNYCDRQGRCNVGCLPGARHTLNKQLMAAVHGGPGGKDPVFKQEELEIWPLTVVDVVESLSEGGYTVHFHRQDMEEYIAGERHRFRGDTVKADVVILAAGCLGTTEIMLRSKKRRTITGLSDFVGYGFSTNGDYIAFLEPTRERAGLIRGPVTTSFGHFNVNADPGATLDVPKQDGVPTLFHTLEDQGIPPAMSSLVGVGVPLIQSLVKGRHPVLFRLFVLVRVFWKLTFKRVFDLIHVFFGDPRERPEMFRSEQELTARMMCVVAMGREAAAGRFRLGHPWLGDTPLRVRRKDGKFHRDPVYGAIRSTLGKLAGQLRDPNEPAEFVNPLEKLGTLPLTHPLGGCRIAASAGEGVVDEYGRVFDAGADGGRGVHRGLYIADAAIIPTALGVNPSLTISALTLRIADRMIDDYGWRLIPRPPEDPPS